MKKISLLFSFLLSCIQMFAQPTDQWKSKHNNIWTWGYGYGLDFSSGSPVSFLSNITGERCAATACDENGKLLFYTNGDSVWNKNGQLMPGSLLPILPAPYSTDGGTRTGSYQGAIIIPVIGDLNQYYIFSLESFRSGFDVLLGGNDSTFFNSQRLFYSVVDMTLDNGNGDIVSGKKGIQVDSLLGAPVVAIPGTSCNIWLLVHDRNLPQFRAYEVSVTGVSENPVISNSGYRTNELIDSVAFPINDVYRLAQMKVSPDNRKIVLTSSNQFNYFNYITGSYLNIQGLEMYDFDPATGAVSNAVVLDSGVNTYGGVFSACFSPDNSKLYSLHGGIGGTAVALIDQYDLTLPDDSTIISMKTTFTDTAIQVSCLKLGPDGKIYMNALNPDSLSRIDFPNNAGVACGFSPNVMILQHGTVLPPMGPYYPYASPDGITMPSDYVIPIPDTTGTRKDTTLYKPAVITLKAPAGYRDYKWSNGSTDSVIQVNAAGTYWVGYRTGSRCEYKMDTTVIKMKLSTNEAIAKGTIGMTVYPNPAHNNINVIISGLQMIKGTLVITDAIGRAVLTTPCINAIQTINTSRLAEGVYIVQYISEDNMVQQHKTLVITK